MARIFVASLDSPRDRSDAEKSVGSPVDRQTIIGSFSDATYPELIDIERRGHGFYAWGLSGNPPENIENWFFMGLGDFVLLGQKDAYRHYAKVLGRYDNPKAALAIWGEVPEEELRQYLFFLSEPIPLSVSYQDLADYLPASFGAFARIPDEAMERIEADFGNVERFARRRMLNTSAGGPIVDMSGMIRLSERDQARLRIFDPQNSKDGRQTVVDAIIKRRGHPQFREALLDAYEHRCALTNFNAADALEAAYIVPFRGKHTHHPSNGLLLRADVHTLFDLGKLAIDTKSMTVVLADDLMETSYRILAGRPLRYPREESLRPSTEALDLHRRLSGL